MSETIFPRFESWQNEDNVTLTDAVVGGLTKRELFAAMAMQGMISALTGFRDDSDNIIINRPRDIAEISCVYADTLLVELGKG